MLYSAQNALWRMFVRQSSTKHCAKQSQSATEKMEKFIICRNLTQSSVVNLFSLSFFFPNEACVLSLSINVFIERLAKWRYWNNTLVVIIAGEWVNAVCLHVRHSPLSSLPPLLDWTVYSFPGSKALKLHHCNGPVFMQLRCPFKRARWYSEVCVCVCMCVCMCTLLMAIAYAWDPFWLEGWTYSDIKKLSLFLL